MNLVIAVLYYPYDKTFLKQTSATNVIQQSLHRHSQIHTDISYGQSEKAALVYIFGQCTSRERGTQGDRYKELWYKPHRVQPAASLTLAEGLSSYDTTIPWKLPFVGTLAWPSLLLPSQGYQGWQHGWCTLGKLQSAVNHRDHKGTGSTHGYIKAQSHSFTYCVVFLWIRQHIHRYWKPLEGFVFINEPGSKIFKVLQSHNNNKEWQAMHICTFVIPGDKYTFSGLSIKFMVKPPFTVHKTVPPVRQWRWWSSQDSTMGTDAESAHTDQSGNSSPWWLSSPWPPLQSDVHRETETGKETFSEAPLCIL